MKTHKDLDVWKESYNLTLKVYKLVDNFPEFEKFGISSQIRRASVSVVSNIAEGAARNGDKEFIYHLYVSLGSLAELETQLLLSKDLGYHDLIEIFSDIEKVKSLLLGLIKYLKNKVK
ncbi:MAG: four helix bundle protein [Candidatus Muiribacteriota bacterium]